MCDQARCWPSHDPEGGVGGSSRPRPPGPWARPTAKQTESELLRGLCCRQDGRAEWPRGPRSAHTHGQRENSRARAGEQLSCEGDAPTGAERGAQRRGAGPPPWRPGRGSATTTLEFRCVRKCFLLKVNFRYHKTSACQGTDPATFSTFQMCHHRPHLVPKYCASAEGPCRRAAGKNVTKSTQQKRRRETHRTT